MGILYTETVKTTYVAIDGEVFDSEYQCLQYESYLLVPKVYAVYNPSKPMTTTTMKLYSTMEKAKDSLSGLSPYDLTWFSIDEICVDYAARIRNLR